MLKDNSSPLFENIGSLFIFCVFQQLVVVFYEVIRNRYFYRTHRIVFSLEKHRLLGNELNDNDVVTDLSHCGQKYSVTN